MEYVVFFIVLIILMLLIEKLTNKILGVQKKKVSETPGKNIDRWGRSIIFVIFISAIWFVITNDSDKILKWFWMTYLTLLIGFQAIMEYIYIKDSKQYITTTLSLIVFLITIYHLEFLLELIRSW